MVKKWIRFCIFCVIFLLLFWWVNLAFSQQSENWRDFYRIPRNTIDVVFIGNSHNSVTFQPRVINDLLPVQSYLLGIGGESMQITYYELRELLKYQKPKLVILETFVMNLERPLSNYFVFGFTDPFPGNPDKFRLTTDFIPLTDLEKIFPAFRSGVNWSDANTYNKLIQRSPFTQKQPDPFLGYEGLPDTLLPARYSAALNTPDMETSASSEENFRYLDLFIDLCRENDVKVMLVTAPILKITGVNYVYYVPVHLDVYAKEKGIDIVNFNNLKLTKIDFGNYDHLSTFGSIKVTAEIAREIANQLGLSMDPQKANYYHSFFFSDYSITQIDGFFILTLHPFVKDEHIEYRCALINKESKTEVESIDWSNNPKCSFAVPDEGEYYFEVKIRNLSGDYQFTSNFAIDREVPVE